MIIDLRSDTFTKPSEHMLEAMFKAEVGDDVFGEDPTINELQNKAADLFGMEAGLFCSSGTQTNQVAINVHTRPGDHVICDQYAHIHFYEGGGIAANSGSVVSGVPGVRGIVTAEQVKNSIKADDQHFPKTTLVGLENTSNKGGGTVYSLEQIDSIREVCKSNNLKFHLDGARVFNAIVESDYSAKDLGKQFDSISICLSKGLGAPVGSVLLGTKDFIYRAHRTRKRFGGGMRQAGYLAAAGIYALDNNIDRLKEDHRKAKTLGSILENKPYVLSVVPIDTNIVMVDIKPEIDTGEVLASWAKNGIKAMALSEGRIRLVTHLDITDEMMEGIEVKLDFN